MSGNALAGVIPGVTPLSERLRSRILACLRDGRRWRVIEIWHELHDLSPQTITNAMTRLHAEGVVKRAPIHHRRIPLYVYWTDAA